MPAKTPHSERCRQMFRLTRWLIRESGNGRKRIVADTQAVREAIGIGWKPCRHMLDLKEQWGEIRRGFESCGSGHRGWIELTEKGRAQ